jgi:hypothetical protein
MSVWKEIVTSVLALGIAAVSLIMLWMTFKSADSTAFAAYKDILLYGLSLFGTVLGYYFGRVPAELHAQQATAQADKAQAQVTQAQSVAANAQASQQQTKENVRSLLTTVKQNLLQSAAPPISNLLATPQSTGLQQAVAEIDVGLKSL